MMRAAVIGAGQIAKQHLGAIGELDDVEVVGVCDLSPVMAESTADRFGIAHWTTDYHKLLAEQRPDVIHLTTPPASHFPIAIDCLRAGAHLLVEKPITVDLDQFHELEKAAELAGLWLVEDHNYRFNHDVHTLLDFQESGRLGDVRHVDVQINLDVFATGSRFADADAPHPAMSEPLSVVSDFITHLAYLAHLFIGPHRSVSCLCRRESAAVPNAISEFKTTVDGERGTATLGFSSQSAPDTFLLRVQGTKMRAEVNLFEVGVVVTEVMGGPEPLQPIRNALRRAKAERRNARKSFSRKLSGGPGAYEGLWKLIELFYTNLKSGGPPPVALTEIREVNELIHAIAREVSSPCTS